jgi:hypothetical protein
LFAYRWCVSDIGGFGLTHCCLLLWWLLLCNRNSIARENLHGKHPHADSEGVSSCSLLLGLLSMFSTLLVDPPSIPTGPCFLLCGLILLPFHLSGNFFHVRFLLLLVPTPGACRLATIFSPLSAFSSSFQMPLPQLTVLATWNKKWNCK